MLVARHLCKTYGERMAVNDVSVTVDRGQIVGLLGPNGAGKSTTVAMLCGLVAPDRGTVSVDGTVINASGKRLIDAPEWTLGAHAEYGWPVASGLDAFVRAEWLHRSEQLSNTFALRYEVYPFISPSYDVANLRAGVSGERWSVNVYAENALDEEYFQNAYEKAFDSGVQVEPSVRTFGIDFRYRFGTGR